MDISRLRKTSFIKNDTKLKTLKNNWKYRKYKIIITKQNRKVGLYYFVICRIARKRKISFVAYSAFKKKKKGSGLGARASTRNLQSGGPNESSATALGAALVKKQAGRKPRPPRRPHGGLPAPWTHCFSKWGHVHLAEMINPELFHSDHMLRCQLN